MEKNKVVRIVRLLILIIFTILPLCISMLVTIYIKESAKLKDVEEEQQLIYSPGTIVTSEIIEKNKGAYYGAYVKYNDLPNTTEAIKSVKWKLFDVQDGKIRLIADTYVLGEYLPSSEKIRKDGNAVYADILAGGSQKTMENYLNGMVEYIDNRDWTSFYGLMIESKGLAVAKGGPTSREFINAQSSNYKKVVLGEKLEKIYTVYNTGSWRNPKAGQYDENIEIWGYWTTTNNGGNFDVVNYNNEIDIFDAASLPSHGHKIGVCPLVTLPAGIKLAQDVDGEYIIM